MPNHVMRPARGQIGKPAKDLARARLAPMYAKNENAVESSSDVMGRPLRAVRFEDARCVFPARASPSDGEITQ